MTYTQALMIVRNATSGYTEKQIREASVFILGSINASEEDILDACNAIGYADIMNTEIEFAPGVLNC